MRKAPLSLRVNMSNNVNGTVLMSMRTFMHTPSACVCFKARSVASADRDAIKYIVLIGLAFVCVCVRV